MNRRVHEVMRTFREELLQFSGPAQPANNFAIQQTRRTELVNAIETVVVKCVTDITSDTPLELKYRSISWTNTTFTTGRLEMKSDNEVKYSHVRMTNIASRPKMLLMLRVMQKAYELLILDSTITQRELYYQLLASSERALDDAVKSVCGVLNAARWELGILNTSKGLVAGSLKIFMPYEMVDCTAQQGGVLVPLNVARVTKIESNASFILVVEKDAIFQKLVEENILDRLGPLILMTGKGFPDVSTRQLLRILWDSLRIPVLLLVDADPHGIEIMCVYRFGSLNQCKLPELAVPEARWVGIHPSDITRLNFPDDCLSPLSDNDKKKADSLLKRPYIQNNARLLTEVRNLISINKKAEIEAVGNFSNAYLTDVYLPFKISNNEFL